MITKKKTAQRIVKMWSEWLENSYYGKHPGEYKYECKIRTESFGKAKKTKYYTVEIWDSSSENKNAFFPVQEVSYIAQLFHESCYLSQNYDIEGGVRMVIT